MSTDTMRAYTNPGLAMFAGVMAGILGAMNLIYGLVLLFNDEWVILAEEGLFYLDVSAAAWGLVIFGAVQLAVSAGILYARPWARIVGIFWASLIIIGNMYWLPAYPFWSLLIIAFGALVIYALAGGLGEEG